LIVDGDFGLSTLNKKSPDPSMTLTDEQRKSISEWIEQDASLSEIQQRLKDEFQISLTYLEARLLADDLKLRLKDHEREPEPVAAPADAENSTPAAPPGTVSVSIDQITRPGSMISGKVTFSDGERAEWHLDQMGRLGLNPGTPGYRPSQQDVMDFQPELEKLARSQGL